MKIEAIFYLTKQCNFNCTYCYKGNQNEKKLLSDKRIDIALFEFNKLKNIDSFYLRIRGGEFSINDKTLPIINRLIIFLKQLRDNGTKVFFEGSTNLAGTIDFFKKFGKILNDSKIQTSIDFSIHYEYFNDKTPLKVIPKIEALYEILPNANYRIVFDNFDLDIINKKETIKKFDSLKKDICYKFSNTYGLFLDDEYIDDRKNYDIRLLIDEHILPLINNNRIPLYKFLKAKKEIIS